MDCYDCISEYSLTGPDPEVDDAENGTPHILIPKPNAVLQSRLCAWVTLEHLWWKTAGEHTNIL